MDNKQLIINITTTNINTTNNKERTTNINIGLSSIQTITLNHNHQQYLIDHQYNHQRSTRTNNNRWIDYQYNQQHLIYNQYNQQQRTDSITNIAQPQLTITLG